MPNWCSTEITITSSKDLSVFYNLVKEWMSSSVRKSGFGNEWLGNIVEKSGIGDSENYNCRGYIADISYEASTKNNDNYITISQETAWSPMNELWYDIIDKYELDASLTYIAIEPGFGIYESNDYQYENCYVVDVYCPGDLEGRQDQIYKLFEGARILHKDYLEEILGELYEDLDFDEALERVREEGRDFLWINEIEYVEG